MVQQVGLPEILSAPKVQRERKTLRFWIGIEPQPKGRAQARVIPKKGIVNMIGVNDFIPEFVHAITPTDDGRIKEDCLRRLKIKLADFIRKQSRFFVPMFHPDPKTEEYEKLVAEIARQTTANLDWPVFPQAMPLHVMIWHWRSRPQSVSIKKRYYPTGKPDASNFYKAVEDAVNRIVWHDDGDVIDIDIRTRYADYGFTPGSLVVVQEIFPEDDEEQMALGKMLTEILFTAVNALEEPFLSGQTTAEKHIERLDHALMKIQRLVGPLSFRYDRRQEKVL